MIDEFTFRNRAVLIWLAGVFLVSMIIVVLIPPGFWLCGIGGILVVVGQIAFSTRTDQWMSWQREGSLNWFEGCAAATGAVLVLVPLGAILLRSWIIR